MVEMKGKVLAFPFFVSLLMLSGIASASPVLTIHSPINGTTYDTDGVILNVTSDELADFYILSKSGRRYYVAYNATTYQSKLYQKAGNYSFTIHANSSSGEGSSTVHYSSSVTNPIEIDDCGYFESDSTKYALVNDISGYNCILMEDAFNISIDLNGFNVNAQSSGAALGNTEQIIIKNGTLTGDYRAIYLSAAKDVIFRNIDARSANYGYYGDIYVDVQFEDSSFSMSGEESEGLMLKVESDSANIRMKDTAINNISDIFRVPGSSSDAPIFYDTFENVTLSPAEGLESLYFRCQGDSQCYIDFIDSDYDDFFFNAYGENSNVIITEHSRLDVSSTDQEGQGVPAALEIDSLSPFEYNPTRRVLSATESDGTGKVYLSNKLSVYESGTNNLAHEESFPSYNVTARSGYVTESQDITFTSPLLVNFTFTFPAAADYILIDSCTELGSGNNYRLDQNISADSDPCMSADGVSGITLDLDGFSINGNGGSSISINDSAGVEVLNGYVVNSSSGISSGNSSGLTLRDLEITGGSTGILLELVSDSVIRDNSIGENEIGINMISSQDITLIGNNLYNNTENVVVDPSEGIIFVNNILQAAKIGLRLIEIMNSVFIGDTITGNNESVILEDSSNVDFIRTNISSTAFDFVSNGSTSSVSNVNFDITKTQHYGESFLYGYFPPYCMLVGEGPGGEANECNGTIMTDVNTSLKVSGGSSCTIKNYATVDGDITVEGGSLDIKEFSVVTGDIINGSGAFISVKEDSIINGDILLENSGEVIVKDSNITGSIETQGTDVLVVKDNEIQGNVLSINDTNTVIKANTIGGNIQITGTGQCDEKNNDVSGSNSGCP
jgi:parallel beta-helix repeat protein